MVKKTEQIEKTYCDSCNNDCTIGIYYCTICQKEKDLCKECYFTCAKCNNYFCKEHISIENKNYCRKCWAKTKDDVKEQLLVEHLLDNQNNSHFNISCEKDSARIFQNVLKTLSFVYEELEIDLNQTTMRIRAIDSSKISLCYLTISFKYFKDWIIGKEREIVQLNIQYIHELLKEVNFLRSLELSKIKGNDITQIIIKDIKLEKIIELKELLKHRIEDLKIENLEEIEYPITFEMDTDYFETIVMEGNLLSENLDFIYNKNKVFLKSPGREINLIFTPELSIIKPESTKKLKEQIVQAYSSKILNRFFSAVDSNIFKKLILSFKETNPLKIELKTSTPMDELIDFVYYIAPRVEDDED